MCEALQLLQVPVTAVCLPAGGDFRLTATLSPANADDQAVTWKSNDEKVVSVTVCGGKAITGG